VLFWDISDNVRGSLSQKLVESQVPHVVTTAFVVQKILIFPFLTLIKVAYPVLIL
jgi:hypothetical protein